MKPGFKDTPTRYKARLVAKGYTKKYGLDYQDTYSPVVKPNSLRTVLALVAAKNLELIQLDIKTSFLYGELKEELYLEQPEGFVVPGRENDVCRLQKSLYGLKQAPRAWNNKFNEFLVKFGLSRCSSDHCVYYRCQEEEITSVLIFVDDGLVCSNRANTLTDILEHLKTFFEVRSFPANRFLGLDINRDREKRQLHLSQPDFISKIMERFNMQTLLELLFVRFKSFTSRY
jgi:ATP-binding cassette subfamily B (MDR/TAP) protein 1